MYIYIYMQDFLIPYSNCLRGLSRRRSSLTLLLEIAADVRVFCHLHRQTSGALFADTSSSSSSSREAGFEGATGRRAVHGGVVRRVPSADAARTSTKFIAHGDPEGGASWEEEFFFERVSGETAVRIVCVDKVRQGGKGAGGGGGLIAKSSPGKKAFCRFRRVAVRRATF